MATVQPLIFDVVWADVPKPDPRDTSPSFTLPLGGAWKPNDWRFVVLGGTLPNSCYYARPGGNTMMPRPSGWVVLFAQLPGSPNTFIPSVLGHRIIEGDQDAEFSLITPADAGPYGAGRPNITAWSGKPGILAFTVRGIDPTFTPTFNWVGSPTATFGDGDPTTSTPYETFVYPSRSLSGANLPGAEILMYTYPTSSVGLPSGWTSIWDNGFSGANVIRPSTSGQTLYLAGKKYTSGSSTGTTTVTLADGIGTPTSGGEHPLPAIGPGFFYLRQAQDVTVTAVAAPVETDAAFSASSVVIGPETTAQAVAAPPEVDLAFGGSTPLFGYTQRDPIILTRNPIAGAVIRWSATGDITFESSLDRCETWQKCTSGKGIPGLRRGATTITAIYIRTTLRRASEADPKPTCSKPEVWVAADNGRIEKISIGTFMVSKDDIEVSSELSVATSSGSAPGVDSHDGGQRGGGRAITMSGTDFSRAIDLNVWQGSYYVAAGTAYEDAVEEMAKDRFPSLRRTNLALTQQTTPVLVYGSSPNTASWQDIKELAQAIGYEAYFDPTGALTLRQVQDPRVGVSVWEIPARMITSMKRVVDDDQVRNWIIVDGEAVSATTGEEIVAVHAEAINDDPNSASNINGKLGPRPIQVTLQSVRTQEQAQQAANALLALYEGSAETVEFVIPPNPALEPGDIIVVIEPQSKASGRYLIQTIETPFSAAQGQRLVCYRQSSDTALLAAA